MELLGIKKITSEFSCKLLIKIILNAYPSFISSKPLYFILHKIEKFKILTFWTSHKTLKQTNMNTKEELTAKEKQPAEQPESDKQEGKEPTKQKRVHGPMQLRVFEKMGMRLSVKSRDAYTD